MPPQRPEPSLAALYRADGFFVLRTPLLPFGARPPLTDPVLGEALWLASPSLHDSLGAYQAAPRSERGRKVGRALARYLARMSARPTPLELCAGLSLGRLGPGAQLTLPPRAAWQRRLHADLDARAERLARPAADARFVQNPTLHRAAGALRYAQTQLGPSGRSYALASAEPTPELERVLAAAGSGAGVTLQALADALARSDPELAPADARAFVEALEASQLLRPAQALPLTGPPPLGDAEPLLRALEAAPLGLAPAAYQPALEALSLGMPPRGGQRLLHAQLLKPAELRLPADVAQELLEGVEALLRLGFCQPERGLTPFRAAFAERYGERTVPLLEVLDEDAGIGLGTLPPALGMPSVLDGLPTAAPVPEPPPAPLPEALQRRVKDALARGAAECVLEPAELPPVPLPRLPDAFAVRAVVAARDAAAVERGERTVLLLPGALGPSGARALGRFCAGWPALREAVEGHLREEEALAPEARFVELVHHPAPAGADVAARPVLRALELPYLGGSGAPPERQLAVQELGLRLRNGALSLCSLRDGRELRPRLTSAHDFARFGAPLYTLLGLLQAEGVTAHLGFDWGELEREPRLPRVRCGRAVLARARWRLSGREVEQLHAAREVSPLAACAAARARWALPRWVCLEEPEGELTLDLERAEDAELLCHAARGGALTLHELYPPPSELPVQGEDGAYVHELIFPFVRRAPAAPEPAPAPVRTPPPPVPVEAPLAGGWLYAKWYGGVLSADRVLLETVAPLVAQARAEGWLRGWFFIRYADPWPHLRLRFRAEEATLRERLVPELSERAAALAADGLLWRTAFEAYAPETERYGGEAGLPLAEGLFEQGSDFALAALSQEGATDPDARFLLAFARIAALYEALGLTVQERLALATRARAHLGEELGATAADARVLSARYRTQRPALEAQLRAAAPPLELRAWATQLRAAALARPVPELALDLAHMEVNRLLQNNPRPQERVLNDFLARAYASAIARGSA